MHLERIKQVNTSAIRSPLMRAEAEEMLEKTPEIRLVLCRFRCGGHRVDTEVLMAVDLDRAAVCAGGLYASPVWGDVRRGKWRPDASPVQMKLGLWGDAIDKACKVAELSDELAALQHEEVNEPPVNREILARVKEGLRRI